MSNEAPIQVKTKLKIFSGLPSLVLYFCVFFILLVFFMLSSNFVPLRGIEVELPRTGGTLTYTSRNFVVTIDKDSRIYFNDAVVKDSGELKRQLSEALNTLGFQPDRERIIIRCDVNAKLSRVAEVLSVAEELNVSAFFMSAGPPRGRTTSFTEPES
jgi:biopolymer transport protein ExbD